MLLGCEGIWFMTVIFEHDEAHGSIKMAFYRHFQKYEEVRYRKFGASNPNLCLIRKHKSVPFRIQVHVLVSILELF